MNTRLLGILRLIRFSNTPTAVADVVAGYLLAVGTIANWQPLLFLVLASVCLYSWGMALNDLYDLEEDRKHSPHRPLVTGAVSLGEARCLLWACVLLGIGLALVAGMLDAFGPTVSPEIASAGLPWIPKWLWPLIFVVGLLVAIWLYDGPGKKSMAAPWVMGSCRGLNLLLGASLPLIAVAAEGQAEVWNIGPWDHWSADVWLCAMALTTYVAGITWYARSESTGPRGWHLRLGAGLMALGVGLLAVGLVVLPDRPSGRADIGTWEQLQPWWPLAILLLNFSVLRKAFVGVLEPSHANVRKAIVAALGNLIFFNAAICLYANPKQWLVAVAVVALILPIKALRRIIPPT